MKSLHTKMPDIIPCYYKLLMHTSPVGRGTTCNKFFIRTRDNSIYAICDGCLDWFSSKLLGYKEITREQYLNYQILK